ncbi:MAG: biotin transporter BioY [Oscillospiraceae bacterium]|jgi:biotin transport system substrate-specific component
MRNKKIRNLVLIAMFAALTAVGAFIRVPTPWSSFTLQVLFVLLAGILLGPGPAAAAEAVYMVIGLLGVPIFTTGGGFASVLSPTFGFIIGFIPAAAVTGLICGHSKTLWKLIVGCVAGLAVIYAIGLPYMAMILNGYLGKGMDFMQIMYAGMIPFLPYDAIKIVFCIALAIPLEKALEKAGLQTA